MTSPSSPYESHGGSTVISPDPSPDSSLIPPTTDPLDIDSVGAFLSDSNFAHIPMRPGLTDDAGLDDDNNADPAPTLITPAPSNPIQRSASASTTGVGGGGGMGPSSLPAIRAVGPNPRPSTSVPLSGNPLFRPPVAKPALTRLREVPSLETVVNRPPLNIPSPDGDRGREGLGFAGLSPDISPVPSELYTLDLLPDDPALAQMNGRIGGGVVPRPPRILPQDVPRPPSTTHPSRPARFFFPTASTLSQPTTDLERDAQGVNIGPYSITDHGLSQPRDSPLRHGLPPPRHIPTPMPYLPNQFPLGTNTDQLWIDPFVYKMIAGQDYIWDTLFGDEERTLVADWLEDRESDLGPLVDSWRARKPMIMLDPDERPAPFAAVRDQQLVLHVALQRLYARDNEFDGIPERANKQPSGHHSVGRGSSVFNNTCNGHHSYYLRLFPCFCTPPNTPLYKASHLHPSSGLDVTVYEVADCPNRRLSRRDRRRSGSSPGPGPFTAAATAANMIPTLTNPDNLRRESEISHLDLQDNEHRISRRRTIGQWASQVHDANSADIEPLDFAYPVIDEAKWGALGLRPPLSESDSPGPSRLGRAGAGEGANRTFVEPPPRERFEPRPKSPSGVSDPPPYSKRPNPPVYTRRNREARSRPIPIPIPRFAPRFPPFASRTAFRGNASTSAPIPDPPHSLPPLSENDPSLVSLSRPPEISLGYYTRQLSPNPSDEEVKEYMSHPVVEQDMDRHRLSYKFDPGQGHSWNWRGPGLGGSGRPDPQCRIM